MKLRQSLLFLCLALPFFLVALAAKPLKDEKPSKSVTEFLKWYQKNHQRLNKMNLVINYVNGSGPTGKNYEMDHNTAEKYMTELKKSGYIHSKFVEKWRKYFKKCEEDFKTNPQKDGPPRGFEFDFVMLSQDYDSELANLDKAEIKSDQVQSNSSAWVTLKFSSGRVLRYELAKQNNVWLITDIAL